MQRMVVSMITLIAIAGMVFYVLSSFQQFGPLAQFLSSGSNRAGKPTYDDKSHTFSSPTGRYSVYMPAMPDEKLGVGHVTIEGFDSKFDRFETNYVYTSDKGSLSVASATYHKARDKQLTPVEISSALDALAASHLAALGANETSRYPVDTQGGRFLGRHIDARLKNQPIKFRNFLDAENPHQVLLLVQGKPEFVNSAEADKFLSSLLILPPASASKSK